MQNRWFHFVTLFASSGTLICCALPSLLVVLGMGSVMASLATNVPGLVWVSQHKIPVFVFAATMLTIGGYMQYRARFMPCPTDPEQAALCSKSRKISRVIYYISLTIFAVGAFMAFIAPTLL